MCSAPGWGLGPLTAPFLVPSQIRGGLESLEVLRSQRPGPSSGTLGSPAPGEPCPWGALPLMGDGEEKEK